MSAHKPTTPSDHWHILGAGAIGSLFAFWLQGRATLILNPNSEYAQQTTISLTIEKKNKNHSFSLACSTAQHATPIKNLLICTKANHTEKALENLSLNDNTNIVLLQNGMGNAELLTQRFPKCAIFCGSTTHGAFRVSPLHTLHAGEGLTYIGSLDKQITTESIQTICASLSSKNNTLIADNKIENRLWIKLAMNCAINPLTVIYQCKNGDLLKTKKSLTHLKKISLELDKMLHLKNILKDDENSFEIISQVAQNTALNYSSMYQDHQHKRSSEIDFIQGYLLTEAKKLHIELPENQKLFDTIKKIEAAY